MIFVGEALFDRLTSDPGASFSNAANWTLYAGGAPANLACALAKLGTESAFIGGIGDDADGAHLRQHLSDARVNVDGVQTLPGHPTRSVFVRHEADAEGVFAGYSSRSDRCANAQRLDPEALPGMLFYATQIFACGTLELAFPGARETVAELAALAQACRLRLFVDVNCRAVFWDGVCSEREARERIMEFLCDKPGADFVKASVEDVRFLFGNDLAEAAFKDPVNLMRAIGAKCTGALVTAGERGAAYAFLVWGLTLWSALLGALRRRAGRWIAPAQETHFSQNSCRKCFIPAALPG